ncbi:hypothetical protein QJS10_CPB18g01009 [Acorus calamus]|uniref:Uncharacterized protein n=1 Tax=Acorus calamus TaxID=4465 RepID=A0AAV9CS16_ACOCL|nr:hypothetical protein QJS10_CPB18g01009 [Acorus calamus]
MARVLLRRVAAHPQAPSLLHLLRQLSTAASVAPSKPKTFSIYQWDPNNPSQPTLKDYQIDLSDCGPMVLDVLIKIKNEVTRPSPSAARVSSK